MFPVVVNFADGAKKYRNTIAILILLAGLFPGIAMALGKTPERPLGFVSGPVIAPNPNPAVPLAAILTFEANAPAHATVEIRAGDGYRRLAFGQREAGKQQLPLVGFHAGIAHEVRLILSDAGGGAQPLTATLGFAAPPLPAEAKAFPVIRAKRLSNAPMEPGVTLFNPRRSAPAALAGMTAAALKRFNEDFNLLVAVDAAGDVIWYYRGDSLITDFEWLANGNVLFLTTGLKAVEIDLLGNVVTQWYAKGHPWEAPEGAIPVDTLTLHHDIDELPNGNFLALGTLRKRIADFHASERDRDAPRQDQWVMGDEVIEFDRTGKVLWRWNAFEHLDVFRIGYGTFSGFWADRGFPGTIDWSHANAVTALDDGSILISYRYQSAITKVDRRTGEIVWIAGEPSGWSPRLREKLLTMKEGGQWFWHQHCPTIGPDGTMLVFDNDTFRAHAFDEPVLPAQARSRMVEYALDEAEMTIEERWSSVHPQDPPVASFAMGSTQYLPRTGNLLAGYGLLLSLDEKGQSREGESWPEAFGRGRFRTRIREYTHDSPPAVVWELAVQARENAIGLGWSLFGARRIESFPPR